jgi:hypothetical protein
VHVVINAGSLFTKRQQCSRITHRTSMKLAIAILSLVLVVELPVVVVDQETNAVGEE